MTMKKIMCMILMLCIITTPVQGLYLFECDYDSDEWTEGKIVYNIPESVNSNWIPLRASSEYLPIDVSWNANTQEIVVYSHAIARKNYLVAERIYKADRLPKDLVVVNGVTYCSPSFLKMMLSDFGFIYNNEVYYFAGENKESKLINPNGNDIFKDIAITSMYELKLKLPEDYAFVRKYLTGGIKCVAKNKVAHGAEDAVSYIYPSSSNPICYIVNGKNGGRTLASYIVHEAYHVYQYKRYGRSGENDAEQYESYIYNALVK